MGTTLTGTTPQDTYDSLIKVTDNGPISGTLKALSDGLGNDSTLSLSTTAASIAGTLAVTGLTTLADNVTLAATKSILGTAASYVNFGYPSEATGPSVSMSSATRAGGPFAMSLNNDGGFSLSNSNASAVWLSILSTGNVGIGTDAPANYGGTTLTVSSPLTTNVGAIVVQNSDASVRGHLYSSGSGNLITMGSATASSVQFVVSDTERMRITPAGNVGIGATAPARLLTLKNNAGATNGISFQSLSSATEMGAIAFDQDIDTLDLEVASSFAGHGVRIMTGAVLTERARFTANGLTFNGDTAAANALDDYEEGTWTMGVSFGGASVGVGYTINGGTYTKIGRQVTVNGDITLTSKGSSTGAARITGLPFTIANSDANYSPPSFWFNNVTFTNQFQGYGNKNNTTIDLSEITNAGVLTALTNADFANNSEVMVSLTYFV
tara:strand:- start:211 stop:1527 length:1317 start_codon:yes stop_codon:yes gene_type:complete